MKREGEEGGRHNCNGWPSHNNALTLPACPLTVDKLHCWVNNTRQLTVNDGMAHAPPANTYSTANHYITTSDIIFHHIPMISRQAWIKLKFQTRLRYLGFRKSVYSCMIYYISTFPCTDTPYPSMRCDDGCVSMSTSLMVLTTRAHQHLTTPPSQKLWRATKTYLCMQNTLCKWVHTHLPPWD